MVNGASENTYSLWALWSQNWFTFQKDIPRWLSITYILQFERNLTWTVSNFPSKLLICKEVILYIIGASENIWNFMEPRLVDLLFVYNVSINRVFKLWKTRFSIVWNSCNTVFRVLDSQWFISVQILGIKIWGHPNYYNFVGANLETWRLFRFFDFGCWKLTSLVK